MDVFTRRPRGTLQNKNAKTVAAPPRTPRELTGDDGNFVVTTDLGNEFARWTGSCPKPAPHKAQGLQRHCRGGPGHPDAEEELSQGWRKGGQWSDHFERAAGVYNARSTRRTARPRTWRSSRPQSLGFSKTTPTSSSNKNLTDRRVKTVENAGAFRAPTNAARSFNPQYGNVQQLGAWTYDRRSTEGRKTLLKLALPAPQGSGRGGPADKTGQAAAVRQLETLD